MTPTVTPPVTPTVRKLLVAAITEKSREELQLRIAGRLSAEMIPARADPERNSKNVVAGLNRHAISGAGE